MKKRETAKCAKCGYSWLLRKKSPKECPNCKSRYWNVGASGFLAGKNRVKKHGR